MAADLKKFPATPEEFKWWAMHMRQYYHALAENANPAVRQNGIWLLGQFLACQWQRLLSTEPVDVEEAKLLLTVLKAERGKQGSQWQEMLRMVETWIESLEPIAQIQSDPVSLDNI